MEQLELLTSTAITGLYASESTVIAAVWDSTDKIGGNRIVVVVDPEDAIAESSETNNTAIKDVYVGRQAGLSMSTTLDSSQYGSNQTANVSITLRNSGPRADATLEAWIEDTNGYSVATFGSISVSMDYGSTSTKNLSWNTGATLAGGYVVRTVLKDAGGAISENTTSFAIAPDAVFDIGLSTDKTSYGPYEDVELTATLGNRGINYIAPSLDATITISNAGGAAINIESRTLSDLLPASTVTLSSLWNTRLAAPGDYSVTVSVSSDGTTVATKQATFRINSVVLLTGAISVSPAVISRGDTMDISYTLANAGNADMTGYTLRLSVMDQETQTVMQYEDRALDLAANTTLSGTLEMGASGYELKTYTVVLQALSPSSTDTLASASVEVKDLAGPVIMIASPLSNASYTCAMDLSVFVSDEASGVDGVYYQLDDGPWNLLPVADQSQGRYFATWSPSYTDNGAHTVSFKAFDKAGNSKKSSVTLMVRLDSAAPTGSVIINNGSGYASDTAVMLSLSCLDAESGCFLMRVSNDGVSWSASEIYATEKEWTLTSGDGPKTVQVKYADAAGHESVGIGADIVLDTAPPALVISTLPDGSYTNSATLNIAGTVLDPTSTPSLTVNSNSVPLNADGSFSQVVTLATGTNAITTEARDLAGNSAVDVRAIVFDPNAPQLMVTAPPDNSVTNVAEVTVIGTVDERSRVDISVKDIVVAGADAPGGLFSWPVTLEYGVNTIVVTATDLAANSSMDKRTVMLDNINPSLAVTNPAQDITTDQPGILLQGTVSDLTALTVTIAMDSATYTPAVTSGAFEQQLTFTSAKTYAASVTAVDAAGNTTTVQRNINYAPATTGLASIKYTGPTFLAQGKDATLSAELSLEAGNATDLPGRTLTFVLNAGSVSQSCSGTTDSHGKASCSISDVKAAPGPAVVTASFSGDGKYQPVSESKNVAVFAYPSSGTFVISNKEASVNNHVTFWGSQWHRENNLGNSKAVLSFKGYADGTDVAEAECDGTWKSSSGSSSHPPKEIPAYMAVLASSTITKSGSTLSGDIKEIVVVKIDPGYDHDPGHSGTGVVVGSLCSQSTHDGGCDHKEDDNDDDDHHEGDNEHDD